MLNKIFKTVKHCLFLCRKGGVIVENGVWRTVMGRKIFIAEGQSLDDVIKKSVKTEETKSKKEIANRLQKKIDKLQKEYDVSKGKDRIAKGKELREKQAEHDKLTGADEERRIERLKKHDVTIQQERILKQMGVEDNYSLDQLEQAIKYDDALKRYTGSSMYKKIRDLENNSEEVTALRKDLESYIEMAPKYNDQTYRGLSFEDKTEFARYLDSISGGSEIDMRGISSWATEKNVAIDFASQKEYKVVFINESHNGVDVSKLSAWKGENEVICSGNDKFIVKSTSENDGIYYVKVSYKNEND